MLTRKVLLALSKHSIAICGPDDIEKPDSIFMARGCSRIQTACSTESQVYSSFPSKSSYSPSFKVIGHNFFFDSPILVSGHRRLCASANQRPLTHHSRCSPSAQVSSLPPMISYPVLLCQL